MQLNHDCIRDIMLYIEGNTTGTTGFVYLENMRDSLTQYTPDEILYHVRQIESAGFIGKCKFYDACAGGFIPKLNWNGHSYLDNIRDKSAWEKLKESGLSSMSLDVAKDLAKELIISLAKQKLHLE